MKAFSKHCLLHCKINFVSVDIQKIFSYATEINKFYNKKNVFQFYTEIFILLNTKPLLVSVTKLFLAMKIACTSDISLIPLNIFKHG